MSKKIPAILGQKNPTHDTGQVRPHFSGQAQAWAGHPRILQCKIAKNSILGQAQAKNFFLDSEIYAQALSTRVRGRAKTYRSQAGPGSICSGLIGN